MVRFFHVVSLFVLATFYLPIAAQAEGLSDLFSTASDSQKSKFLPVEQAFKVTADTAGTKTNATLTINFDITPGHYVYKDKVKLSLPDGVTAESLSFNQSAQFVDDPQFGRVPVFDQRSVIATTTLTNAGAAAIDNAPVTITWQGCAKAGLCYPPEKIKTTVTLATPAKSAANAAVNDTAKAAAVNANGSNSPKLATPRANEVSATSAAATEKQPAQATAAQQPDTDQDSSNPLLNNTESSLDSDTEADENRTNGPDEQEGINDLDSQDDSALIATAIEESSSLDNDEQVSQSQAQYNSATTQSDTALVNQDPFGLGTHPWLALGLLFLAGLGLAFTPCVLPMLPIVANIVGNQSNPTPKKAAILTSSYALGVAIAYGFLGAIIAVFGQSLGIIGWLQNPVILLSFAAVFILLALYMLELVPLRLPLSIRNKLTAFSDAGNNKLGSAGGSLIAGFLSALVVSPCVSAPLFGALLAVSTIGNPLLGFGALFMLGFGLSAPLIVLGTTQGSIMPKAGEWMNWVKQGFALLLFAVALLLIERVFISSFMLLIWAVWFMVVAVWAWQWRRSGQILTRALGLIAAVWATVLVVGAALGNTDSLHPLASLKTPSANVQPATESVATPSSDTLLAVDQAIHVTTLDELDAITAKTAKVVVDVTADWCIECRIMDKALFASPPAQLTGWQVVKLDITDTTAESKAILARYQLFGPPALLYYMDGKLVGQQVGETDRDAFINILNQLQS